MKIKLDKSDIITLVVIVILIIAVVLSPGVYLIATAKWTDWDEKDRSQVVAAMGEDNTELNFRTYFQFYNVVHELGHGLIRYNKGIKVPIVEEEQLVNNFAVAYWRYYGQAERIDRVYDIVTYAVQNVGDNYKNGIDYMQLGKENSSDSRFYNSFFNFTDYGWFQFSSVKYAIEHEKTLEEALNDMGLKDCKLTPKVLVHDVINEEESTKIVNEAIDNFHEWGLKFKKAEQKFKDDPNMNASGPAKKIFGLFAYPPM